MQQFKSCEQTTKSDGHACTHAYTAAVQLLTLNMVVSLAAYTQFRFDFGRVLSYRLFY